MAGQTGMVYLSITDHGGPDRLTGVSSPAAEKAELYQMSSAHGVMAMHVRAVAAGSLRARPWR